MRFTKIFNQFSKLCGKNFRLEILPLNLVVNHWKRFARPSDIQILANFSQKMQFCNLFLKILDKKMKIGNFTIDPTIYRQIIFAKIGIQVGRMKLPESNQRSVLVT